VAAAAAVHRGAAPGDVAAAHDHAHSPAVDLEVLQVTGAAEVPHHLAQQVRHPRGPLHGDRRGPS
jgi:hypothetical protein